MSFDRIVEAMVKAAPPPNAAKLIPCLASLNEKKKAEIERKIQQKQVKLCLYMEGQNVVGGKSKLTESGSV